MIFRFFSVYYSPIYLPPSFRLKKSYISPRPHTCNRKPYFFPSVAKLSCQSFAKHSRSKFPVPFPVRSGVHIHSLIPPLPPFSRAPPPPVIESTSSSSSSDHVHSVPISEIEDDAEDAAEATKEKTSELADEASSFADEVSQSASSNYNKGKKAASKKAEQAKDKAIEARDDLSANRDNPVVVANAVLVAVAAVGLGVGAYHKHSNGELNWGVVGRWAGVVGLFGGGDYFVSQ